MFELTFTISDNLSTSEKGDRKDENQRFFSFANAESQKQRERPLGMWTSVYNPGPNSNSPVRFLIPVTGPLTFRPRNQIRK